MNRVGQDTSLLWRQAVDWAVLFLGKAQHRVGLVTLLEPADFIL